MTATVAAALIAPPSGGSYSGGFLVNRALLRHPGLVAVNAASAGELAAMIERTDARTLIVDSLYLFSADTSVVLARAADRRPVVLLAHSLPSLIPGPQIATRRSMLQRERSFLARVSGAIAPSAFMSGALVRRGLTPARVRIVAPAPICDGRRRARLAPAAPTDGRPLRVLTVANRTPAKGITDAAAALGEFGRRYGEWRWTLVGSDEPDPAYAAEVRSLTAQPALRGHVVDLPAQEPAALRPLYEDADVFLLPSYMESYGLVFVEAISFGLPAVGYHCGAVPEVVEDAGILVDPGDTDALVEALATTAGNRLADRVRERSARLGNWTDALRALDEAVSSLAFDGGSP